MASPSTDVPARHRNVALAIKRMEDKHRGERTSTYERVQAQRRKAEQRGERVSTEEE